MLNAKWVIIMVITIMMIIILISSLYGALFINVKSNFSCISNHSNHSEPSLISFTGSAGSLY